MKIGSSSYNEREEKRSLLGIRLPKVKRSPIHVNEEFSKFKESFSKIKRLCPHDGTPLIVENELSAREQENENGEIIHHLEIADKLLICPHCGYTLSANNLISIAKQNAEKYKKEEIDMQIYAGVMLVVFALFSYMFSNLLTLVCGLMFTLILLMRSFLARYRYWQAINERIFAPPFKEWLKQEFK